MVNFEYSHPTQVYFGRGEEKKVGEKIAAYGKKVLLVYGGGSIKRSGLYDTVVASLKEAGVAFEELGGVQPNPRLSLVYKGLELVKENGLEAILAVGGGSAIDTAKAIGVGAKYDGDVWDFYCGKASPKETLPVGCVLTIAAAGSETSNSSVITNEDGMWKRGLGSEVIRPAFAIMNPELTYTLPAYQTACGICDIMMHILERYFTNEQDVDLTDRLCEGALVSIIRNAPIVLEDPENYAARAEIMWAGSLAHDGLMGTGRVGDFASHQLGHELSAKFDVAHGASLSVVFPAWMRYCLDKNPDRFVKFAHRVMAVPVDFDDPMGTAINGIYALENFWADLGLPIRLEDLGIGEEAIAELAAKCKKGPAGTTGNYVPLDEEAIAQVYRLAL